MRFVIAIAALVSAQSAISAGPLSKFSERSPVGDYISSRSLEDIERCLIDMDGWLAPNVYRQPDKPNEVKILWISGGMSAGLSAARVDLTKTPDGGTRVISWMPAKQAKACAPERAPN